jgi:hypothetical protein
MTDIQTEVLVCGGGCAGLGAALAAARNGARVLLIERAGFSGGIITTVGLPFFDGIAHKTSGQIVVRGIALELLARLGVCKESDATIKPHNPMIPSSEGFKILADQLLGEQRDRLRVLYHTLACQVTTRGDRIDTVRVANKSGLTTIRPEIVIDCTGDGDIGAWAGAPFEKATPLMPMTLHFRIGNVRRTPETTTRCREALVRLHAAGKLPMFYGPGVMFHFAPDEVYLHAVRVSGDATDPDDLTRAEIQGRQDAWTMWDAWRREVPGFEESYFIGSYPFIGVRETRRIMGPHVLTEEDIRAARKFDDAVATGCWYLDIHPNEATPGKAQPVEGFQPEPYDIPYRSILASKVANLLVAGRCHSATRAAASSTRVTVTAMALGQAAGTAAALCLQKNASPHELPGSLVRQTLEQQHAGPALRT